jgi:hypothetical protein
MIFHSSGSATTKRMDSRSPAARANGISQRRVSSQTALVVSRSRSPSSRAQAVSNSRSHVERVGVVIGSFGRKILASP